MEIILLWSFVLAWMAKRGAEDLVHAVKGTPNPRYELKKAKARAAGQPVKGQPRYATKEWAADLLSDALVAHTEKRRTKAKAKAQPVDDMIGILREPKAQARPVAERRDPVWEARREPGEPEWLTPAFDETELLAKGRKLCPRCGVVLLDELSDGSTRCPDCGPKPAGRGYGTPEWDAAYQRLQDTVQKKIAEWDEQKLANARESDTADETLAQVIQFPNIKNIEKEITMLNSEATGLTTAIAFADAAADAHQTFSTAGSEGYAGALEAMGFGEGIKGLAAEAREASATATAKWAALSAAMTEFMQGREFYANNPDAPEKAALVNE